MMLTFAGPDGVAPGTEALSPPPTVNPVPDSDHLQLIDPGEEAWSTVLETIRAAVAATGAGFP